MTIMHIKKNIQSNDKRSIVEMLESVIYDIKYGRVKGDKAILLILNDDGDDNYEVESRYVNIKMSQSVALLYVAQADCTSSLIGEYK